MFRNQIIWSLGVLALLAACTSLPYKDDNGFLVSAQADSPEFPVYINNHLCTDMEGSIGLCSKRIKSNEDVTFSFNPQNYSYLLTMSCPTGITPIPPTSVPAHESFSFTLTKEMFLKHRTFVCIGEVSPQDRSEPVSAKFEVHIVVTDSKYVMRERIFLINQAKNNSSVLVLGQYARNSFVFDQGKWQSYSQETMINIKGDPTKVKAFSESFSMRYNYFNLGASDAHGLISNN